VPGSSWEDSVDQDPTKNRFAELQAAEKRLAVEMAQRNEEWYRRWYEGEVSAGAWVSR
jgi:hypothetical protein